MREKRCLTFVFFTPPNKKIQNFLQLFRKNNNNNNNNNNE
tara:strand:- start:4116 stop:4235 length:120 start_codon:yes stop_codon:yes gene_type:complete